MVSTFALGVAALAAEREAPQQRHVCAMDVREAGFVQHGPVVAPLASNAQQLAALLIGSISGPRLIQSNQILAAPIGVGTPRRNTFCV